jgi:hypothetical protein
MVLVEVIFASLVGVQNANSERTFVYLYLQSMSQMQLSRCEELRKTQRSLPTNLTCRPLRKPAHASRSSCMLTFQSVALRRTFRSEETQCDKL